MAYKFKHGETVPQNVKRIAHEEIGSAIDYLRGKGGRNGYESIHETRKCIKKTRALIRLVQWELGDFYSDQNVQLRDTGRKLSELRDAGALIGTLDNLRKRTSGSTGRGSKGAPLATVRRLLTEQKHRLEEQAETSKLKPALATELLTARQTVKYWPLETDGFRAIEPGIEKTVRDGRKNLRQARRTGRREDFHEWRKRVKDHWYQVRLLQKIWGDVMEAYEKSLEELEDALGEDLNLAILAERVQSMAAENGNGLKAGPVTKAIDASRKALREHALEIGERVYAEKPRDFVRRIKRLWKAW
jgi:CHAD domain-containing protein